MTARKFLQATFKSSYLRVLTLRGKKRKTFCAKKKAKREKIFCSVPVKTKQIIKNYNRDITSNVNIPKALPAKEGGTLTRLNAMLVMATIV